jgi:hypothetical protein
MNSYCIVKTKQCSYFNNENKITASKYIINNILLFTLSHCSRIFNYINYNLSTFNLNLIKLLTY